MVQICTEAGDSEPRVHQASPLSRGQAATTPRRTPAPADVNEREAAANANGDARPRLLIITPLDIDKLLNNLEHHRIDHYRKHGYQVTVVYKTMNQSLRLGDLLRNTFLCSIRERRTSDVRLIAVDPPFNYFAGLGQNAQSAVAGDTALRGGRPSMRVRLIRLLSPLSVLRDVFTTPFLCLAVLLRVRDRADVALGFGPWGGLAGLLLRKLGRVDTLVYEDRDYEPGLVPDRFRQWYTAAVERLGINRADLAISISQMLSDRRRQELARTTEVIPSGVDWARFAATRAAVTPHRSLIYVGNVIGWSGLEHAILALRQVRAVHPDATLTVVGTGVPNYVKQLRRLAAEQLPEGAVRFLGHQDPKELPHLLDDARIGLANAEPVPFRRYATPLKVLEYMAAGLPVIATEHTEAGIIVRRTESGQVIPYDVHALADAVLRLLGDEALFEAQRRNAIHHSREYDWERLLTREQQLIAEHVRK